VKRFGRAVGWLLITAVLGYLAVLGWVWRVSRLDERSPADAIVVLGAAQYNGRPSPVLKARLDHAIELFRAGLAPMLVVTGGIGTGDRVSEASVGHRYLRSHQIPDSAIIVRPDGRTTEESMRSVAEWMHERELARALLVSDPFHMARLSLEARRADLEPTVSPTRTSPIVPGSRTEAGYLALEAIKFPLAAARTLLGHKPIESPVSSP
jgi:uncharacterized SAM-binding protein YcdF (DUF218 family)